MKRLNKKGFTLIELLAVIVILAVVMVVTIPSVLNSMASARRRQAINAIHSIEEYVQKNYDICVSNLSNEFNDLEHDSTIFTTSGNDKCVPKTDTTIITAAGYKTEDIASITGSIVGNKYKITAAEVMDNGKFNDVTGKHEGITFSIKSSR